MDLSNSKLPRSIDPSNKAIPDSNSNSNSKPNQIRTCSECKTTKTPVWRVGPNGPKSLCNACGIKYRKRKKDVKVKDTNRKVIELKKNCMLREEEQAAFVLMDLSSENMNSGRSNLSEMVLSTTMESKKTKMTQDFQEPQKKQKTDVRTMGSISTAHASEEMSRSLNKHNVDDVMTDVFDHSPLHPRIPLVSIHFPRDTVNNLMIGVPVDRVVQDLATNVNNLDLGLPFTCSSIQELFEQEDMIASMVVSYVTFLRGSFSDLEEMYHNAQVQLKTQKKKLTDCQKLVYQYKEEVATLKERVEKEKKMRVQLAAQVQELEEELAVKIKALDDTYNRMIDRNEAEKAKEESMRNIFYLVTLCNPEAKFPFLKENEQDMLNYCRQMRKEDERKAVERTTMQAAQISSAGLSEDDEDRKEGEGEENEEEQLTKEVVDKVKRKNVLFGEAGDVSFD